MEPLQSLNHHKLFFPEMRGLEEGEESDLFARQPCNRIRNAPDLGQ
jgi:hypothetical protein